MLIDGVACHSNDEHRALRRSGEPSFPLNDRGILSVGGATSGDCFNSTAATPAGSFLSDPDSSGMSNGLSSELSDAALAELMVN